LQINELYRFFVDLETPSFFGTLLAVRRQLFIPVVLPHSGMLLEIFAENLAEQFGTPCHWIIALADPQGEH
jgi:hypothetical protein